MMWESVKLSEIVTFVRGLTYSKKDEVDANGLAVLRATNVSLKHHKIILDEIRFIKTPVKLNEDKLVKVGDILMCTASGSKSHLGKCALVKEDLGMAFGGFMAALRCKSSCLPEYLFYILTSNSFMKKLSSLSDGANINNLKFSLIEDFEFLLPPLEEQERIVAKLDAVFAEIDEAVSKTLKKIKNNDDLFESILNETFQNSTFKYENLDNICKIVGGGTPSKKNKSFYDGTIPWATVRDLGYDNLNKTEHQITNNAVNESSTNIIPAGNIVIATRVGLGKVCILSQNTAINQDLKGIIPINNEKTDKGFLFFWFKSIRNVIINAGTGATVQGVRLDFIKSLKIPNLELPLQKQITSKLSIISEKNKLLNSIYKEKINNLAKLKSNILQQEFQVVESA